ncbi:MAG: peptidase domain-containing ABC transporter [Allosphingosinicella sp.]
MSSLAGLSGGKRVRLIRQTEVSECGLAALAMVANFHGLDIDLSVLRRHYAPSLRGAAIKSIMAVADNLGLTPRPVRLPLGEIPNLHLPAILHWNLNHYVVVERCKTGRGGFTALIHDPMGRSTWMSREELSDHFTGVALELRPSENFETAEVRERIKISQLWRRMTGLKRAVAQTLLLTLVLQAFILASPYFMQLAVDSAIPAQDKHLINVLAIGFGLFALINIGASALRSHVLLNVGTSIGFGMASNIARKLFRVRIDWFEKRHTGDILSRFGSILPVQQMLTTGALATVLDGSMAVFTVTLMFLYSPLLTFVSLAAFCLYLLARLVTFALQRSEQEASIVTDANAQSVLIESIRGITTLRLFGKETERHALWQTQAVDAVNARLRLGRLGIWQSTANIGIFALENIVVIWLAVHLVIDGAFSVGMVFAFMAYKLQFQGSATSLVDQGIAFRMLDLHLERLGDIALATDDRSFDQRGEPYQEILGRVELRGIQFRYSASDPVVLKGIDLIVEPGEHVAITGPSGGGKSTLVKVLLGLVEPNAGEILIDGMPLGRFGYRNYRQQVGAVLQKDMLFGGSLASNIALFDEEPDMGRIIQAAQAAAIHDDILQMPMQYETLVGEMGSSLSGGQQQRVLLARALYRRPRILIIDEGTSHLDAAREAAVNEAIGELNITRIVVAHRQETIMTAARILYLVDGNFVDEPLRTSD